MRLPLSACAATFLFIGGAAGQATPPPDPVPPPPPVLPSEQPGPRGSIQIGERFDDGKGIPTEGYRSYAQIQERASEEWIEGKELPFGTSALVGSYKVTAFWQTGPGPPGFHQGGSSNYCAAYLSVREGAATKLTVLRNAAGCRIVANPVRGKKKCKTKRDKAGKLKCRRPRLEPAQPDIPQPGVPPLGKPFPTIRVTSSADDFGSVPVGTTSAPITYTLTNISAMDRGPLTIDFSPDVNPDFAVSADTCTGQTLAPNAACTFDIRFTPSAPGFSQDGFVPTYPGGNGGVGVGVRGTGV